MPLPEPLQQLSVLLQHQPAAIRQLIAYLPQDLQKVAQTPEGLLAIIVTAAVGILCLFLLPVFSSRKKGNTIILAGPVNAGKTTLFLQLRDGTQHNGVVASMQDNAAVCSVSPGKGKASKQVRILDIPGHHSYLQKLGSSLSDAAGVVFLVDAVEITPHRVEAAEMLYELLVNPLLQRRRTAVLIACNKADLDEDAHSIDFIRKTLEKQLDTMRKTKTAAIGKDSGSQVPALGSLNKPFSLQGLPNKVVLAECSAKEGQLDDIKAFIGSCL
eukprot:GHRR01006240.1.p1 GENE.GHRR01006240.1~~GHRR01006240.1.p1  ORF type:complete len:271 (+),score=67.33 GHRR01006240.1:329-1141(+)